MKAEASGGALSIIPGRTAGCPGVVAGPVLVKRAVGRLGVAAVTIGFLAFDTIGFLAFAASGA